MTVPECNPPVPGVQALPDKATYRPTESIQVDVAADVPITATVYHLCEGVTSVQASGPRVDLGLLPVGGYGIEIHHQRELLTRTAVEVIDQPRSRLRYGFVADFSPGRDPHEVQRHSSADSTSPRFSSTTGPTGMRICWAPDTATQRMRTPSGNRCRWRPSAP